MEEVFPELNLYLQMKPGFDTPYEWISIMLLHIKPLQI